MPAGKKNAVAAVQHHRGSGSAGSAGGSGGGVDAALIARKSLSLAQRLAAHDFLQFAVARGHDVTGAAGAAGAAGSNAGGSAGGGGGHGAVASAQQWNEYAASGAAPKQLSAPGQKEKEYVRSPARLDVSGAMSHTSPSIHLQPAVAVPPLPLPSPFSAAAFGGAALNSAGAPTEIRDPEKVLIEEAVIQVSAKC
jgi:hypothetical protein